MKVYVKGINGCGMRKTNVQRYCDFLVANGHELVSHPGMSDVVLLWTCAFRRDFRDNSLDQIERYQTEFRSRLVVAGCLPDIDRKLLTECYDGPFVNWRDDERKMKEFFGAPRKELSEIKRILGEQYLCDDVQSFRKDHPDKDASFIDHFNKLFVAEGCRFECSYCAERLAFPAGPVKFW